MFSMMLSGLICGALLGFVMQRGRFCLTGGFRDMYIAKNNRMFYALLIAISVQSVGVFALIQAGVLTYDAGTFPWLGTVVGGYVLVSELFMRAGVLPEPGIVQEKGLLAVGLRCLPTW